MSLRPLYAILQDGSIPDPGLQQNTRATIRIPRGTDAVVRVNVLSPAAVVVPIEVGDELLFTVKRSPSDEAPAMQLLGVPILTTPINAAFTLGAGVLGAGARYYRVSAVNVLGETLASIETSLTIAAPEAPAGVNVNWVAVANATEYSIYGRSTGAELFMATVDAPATTWLDDGSITPAGALPDGIGIWEVTIQAADTIDLDRGYVYDVVLVHGGLRDVVIPASPFIVEPSPGYRP
jgi:hypothetical protein